MENVTVSLVAWSGTDLREVGIVNVCALDTQDSDKTKWKWKTKINNITVI